MAKQNAINIFDRDSYSKGGGLFPAGPAHIHTARFGTFDFNRPGNDQVCLILMVTPMDASGDDLGDPRAIYYPVGKGVDLVNPVKGEKGMYSGIQIAEDSEFDQIFGAGDFGVFMDSLLNAEGFDADAQNDITDLDDSKLVLKEFFKPITKKKKDDDDEDKKDEGKAKEWRILIVESWGEPEEEKPTKGKDKGKDKDKAKSKGKAKDEDEEEPEEDEDEDEESEDEDTDDDADSIIEKYLKSELKDKLDGTQALNFRMGLVTYAKKTLKKDADVAKAAHDKFKEKFGTYLAKAGWKEVKNKLVKD